MDRKTWLLKTSRQGYLDGRAMINEVKSIRKELRLDERTAVIVDTLLDTARRERIIGIPYNFNAYLLQCKRQKIEYAISDHIKGGLYLDLRSCSDKQRNYFLHGLKSASLQETVGTDTDVKYGATARLSPTVQKMRK